MFISGERLSAHSTRPKKIPGWIILVRENFSGNKFYIWLSLVFSKKSENNSISVLNWHAKENQVMNNKDNRVLISRNYRSDMNVVPRSTINTNVGTEN